MINPDGKIGDFWTARGWADLYLTPNTRVGAEFNYRAWDDYLVGFGTSFDSESWGVVVDGEHRFAGTPVSAWIEGRFRHDDIKTASCGGGRCETEIWAGMVGFRIFLDGAGTTLHAHDKMVPWDGGLFDVQTISNSSIAVLAVEK